MDGGTQRLSGSVSGRVAEVMRAAEDAAAGIEADARAAAEAMRAEAERALADARAGADQILNNARAEGQQIVQQSQAEAEKRLQRAGENADRLGQQAEELRGRVSTLGNALADEIRARVAEIGGQEVVATSSRTPLDDLAAAGNGSEADRDERVRRAREAGFDSGNFHGRTAPGEHPNRP